MYQEGTSKTLLITGFDEPTSFNWNLYTVLERMLAPEVDMVHERGRTFRNGFCGKANPTTGTVGTGMLY